MNTSWILISLLGAFEMAKPNILLNTFNPIFFLLSFNILYQYIVSFPSLSCLSLLYIFSIHIQTSRAVPYLLHSRTVCFWHFFPRPYYQFKPQGSLKWQKSYFKKMKKMKTMSQSTRSNAESNPWSFFHKLLYSPVFYTVFFPLIRSHNSGITLTLFLRLGKRMPKAFWIFFHKFARY